VWKAVDTTTGRTVALKLLNPMHATPDAAWAEATRLTRLESPHLVRVHGAALAIDIPYIDMALAEGGSTAKKMTPYGVPQAVAVRWAQQVSRGLQLCHSNGLVHRDVKPDNVLLSRTNEALLGDFGVAAIMALDGTASEHGDAEIRAPEAFGGRCSAVGDVYSLGATLFAFLTGRYPHVFADHGNDLNVFVDAVSAGAPDIRDVAPHVNRTLAGVVRTALSVDPGARYQTAAEVDAALSRVHATSRTVHQIPPHDPGGRCWDAEPAGAKGGSTIHVCATPNGKSVTIDAYHVASNKRLRQHCRETTPAKAAVQLRKVFDALNR
jgi:serine/threonine-protein kinase